jgi:hypothetical protein
MKRTTMLQLERRLFDVSTKNKPITYFEMQAFKEREREMIISVYKAGYNNGNIENNFNNL